MDAVALSPTTGDRLLRLLGEKPGAPQVARGLVPGSSSLGVVLVRCDSATAAGGSGAAAQCYPGTILNPAASDTTFPTAGAVWLTVLGPSGVPAVPEANRVYECVLLGDLTISSTTKPRAVAPEFPGAVGITNEKQLLGDGWKLVNDAFTVNYSGGHTPAVALPGTTFTGTGVYTFVVWDGYSDVPNQLYPLFAMSSDPTGSPKRRILMFSPDVSGRQDESILTVSGLVQATRQIYAPDIAAGVGSGTAVPSGTIWAGTTFRIGAGGIDGITETNANALFVVRGGIVTGQNGTAGDLAYFDGTRWRRLAIGSTGNVLSVAAGLPSWATPATGITSIDGATPTSLTGYLKGNGTDVDVQAVPIPIADTAAKVSSVGLTMPGGFTVTDSPVTSSGTIAVTLTGELERTGVAKLFGQDGINGYLALYNSVDGDYNTITAAGDSGITVDTNFTVLGNASIDGGLSLSIDLAVTHGGTGASSASAARTNLGLAYASQAEQETGTATDRVVAPGTQKFHPSAAKAWVYFTVSGTTVTVQASYNVASVTRNGVGNYRVNFTTAFSSANYAAACSAGLNTAGTFWCVVGTQTHDTTYCQIQCIGLNNTGYDVVRCSVACYGDQ